MTNPVLQQLLDTAKHQDIFHTTAGQALTFSHACPDKLVFACRQPGTACGFLYVETLLDGSNPLFKFAVGRYRISNLERPTA